MEKTYLEQGKIGRDLYENISSDNVTKNSRNLVGKIGDVFKNNARNLASGISAATLL